MSVRYGFMTEIYGFTHSLRTCLARDADASRWRLRRGRGIEDKSRDIEDG